MQLSSQPHAGVFESNNAIPTQFLAHAQTFDRGGAVCGYCVYQDIWKPSIGEKLVAKQEFNNSMDKHAVKVVKGDETVGHLSPKFSQIA